MSPVAWDTDQEKELAGSMAAALKLPSCSSRRRSTRRGRQRYKWAGAAKGEAVLSEKVLEELVRRTGLSQNLITAAWPSLSTESRLQILLAVQETNTGSLPAWLSQMALRDPAEIVRYFGARLTHFMTPEDLARFESGQIYFGTKPTPADIEVYERACVDPSELVRASVNKGNALNYKTITTTSQKDRLVFIRGLTLPTLGPFAEWLVEAIAAGLDDDDLYECAQEFFSLPIMQREMERDPADYSDGMDAYSAGEGLRTAWEAARKAGPKLQSILAFHLPTRMGLHTCKVEDLASMPEVVVSTFVYRHSDSKEIDEVIQLMRDHPERFPEEALDSLRRADEYGVRATVEEVAKARAQAAVDRSEVMLDTMLELQAQVRTLQEGLEQLQQAATRKRGLFG